MIGCNIILGNSLYFWKHFLWVCVGLQIVWNCIGHAVERTKTEAEWTAFVCTIHETEEVYGTIVILITSLWPSESLVYQHDVLQAVTWLSSDNWRVGAKWHVRFRGWRGSDAVPLLPCPPLPTSEQFLWDPLDDYWCLNVQTVTKKKLANIF